MWHLSHLPKIHFLNHTKMTILANHKRPGPWDCLWRSRARRQAGESTVNSWQSTVDSRQSKVGTCTQPLNQLSGAQRRQLPASWRRLEDWIDWRKMLVLFSNQTNPLWNIPINRDLFHGARYWQLTTCLSLTTDDCFSPHFKPAGMKNII